MSTAIGPLGQKIKELWHGVWQDSKARKNQKDDKKRVGPTN